MGAGSNRPPARHSNFDLRIGRFHRPRQLKHHHCSLAKILLRGGGGQSMANALNGISSVMIREMMTMVDVGALLADPCFYGFGIPRGDGRLVAVLPGLLGSDLYLQPLRNWLQRVGYSPVRSTLEFNAGCLQRLREQV